MFVILTSSVAQSPINVYLSNGPRCIVSPFTVTSIVKLYRSFFIVTKPVQADGADEGMNVLDGADVIVGIEEGKEEGKNELVGEKDGESEGAILG